MALPAGYTRAANGFFYDSGNNGPFSIDADGTPWLVGTMPGSQGTPWSYAAGATGIVNSVAAVEIAPAVATKINYLTNLQIAADPLGVASAISVISGAGTVLWRSKAGVAGFGPVNFTFPKGQELKSAVGESLSVVLGTLSVTGGVFANAQGYYK